jgi:hypothetical protein
MDNHSSTLLDPDLPVAFPDVLPSLLGVLKEHGYEAGYARGVSDMHLVLLEAVEEFAALQSGSAPATRKLLHAFSQFLERKLEGRLPMRKAGFVDGDGI